MTHSECGIPCTRSPLVVHVRVTQVGSTGTKGGGVGGVDGVTTVTAAV